MALAKASRHGRRGEMRWPDDDAGCRDEPTRHKPHDTDTLGAAASATAVSRGASALANGSDPRRPGMVVQIIDLCIVGLLTSPAHGLEIVLGSVPIHVVLIVGNAMRDQSTCATTSATGTAG